MSYKDLRTNADGFYFPERHIYHDSYDEEMAFVDELERLDDLYGHLLPRTFGMSKHRVKAYPTTYRPQRTRYSKKLEAVEIEIERLMRQADYWREKMEGLE